MKTSLFVKACIGIVVNNACLLKVIKKNNNIILCYHRVLPSDSDQLPLSLPGMCVTDVTLRCHIEFLRKYYKLVQLNELIVNSSSEPCCAITFDDGWRDNYSYAYSIFKELRVPATIFLSTGFIEDGQWPWPDRLMYYSRFHCASDILYVINTKTNYLNRYKKCHTVLDIIMEMKKLQHNDILHLMDNVDANYAKLHSDLHITSPAMTWENIHDMSDNGVDFGLHSHAHIIANKVTPTCHLYRDYRKSIDVFQSRLGKKPRLFAYPNGDYTSDAQLLLEKLQFAAAVTTEAGCVNKAYPMALNRILLHQDISATSNLLAYRLATSIYQ
jgi:hypothetical protein